MLADRELTADAIDAEGAVQRIEHAAAGLVDAVTQDAAALEASFVHDVARLYASAALLAEEHESGEGDHLTQEQADRVADALTALGQAMEASADDIATSEAGGELARAVSSTTGEDAGLFRDLWDHFTGSDHELDPVESMADDRLKEAEYFTSLTDKPKHKSSGPIATVGRGLRALAGLLRPVTLSTMYWQLSIDIGDNGTSEYYDLVQSYLDKVRDKSR